MLGHRPAGYKRERESLLEFVAVALLGWCFLAVLVSKVVQLGTAAAIIVSGAAWLPVAVLVHRARRREL